MAPTLSSRSMTTSAAARLWDSNEAAPAKLDVRRNVAVSTPSGGHRNVGGSFTFTAVASQGYSPYTYQWKFNGSPLIAGDQLSGSNILSVTGTSMTIHESPGRATRASTPAWARTSTSRARARWGESTYATLSVTDLLDVSATTLDSSPYAQPKLYAGESFTLSVTPSGGTAPYSLRLEA